MSAANDPPTTGLPPLAAEDHVCPSCALSYEALTLEAASALVATLPDAVGRAVACLPVTALRVRPSPQVWSVAEYVCHLRDVVVSTTVRLHRARTEARPVLEPLFNDWRARRFRYADADLAAVRAELTRATGALAEEVATFTPPDWDRTVSRLAGEQRSARWLLRQGAHEGVHHVSDIVAVGRQVAAAAQG